MSSSLYARRPPALRLDVLPFLLAYFLTFSLYFTQPELETLATCIAPAIVTAHLLTFLMSHWSLSVRCVLQHYRVAHVSAASCAHASSDGAKPALCELVRRPLFKASAVSKAANGKLSSPSETANAVAEIETSFEFRKRTYIVDRGNHDRTTIHELPMKHNLAVGEYLMSRGLRQQALELAEHTYNPNVYEIPQRTFADLLREHALAPFFLFQVMCVALWSLDDYWYYSLLTLFMLVVFECTVVQSRLRNLEEMRSLAASTTAVLALRNGTWRSLSSEDLLPGDLVALARSAPSFFGEQVESVCPADVVLLQGSVTVNESALTGESTPLLKEPLDSLGLPADTPLCMRRHRASIVLGGTKLLQHASSVTGAVGKVPTPPGGGAVGYVLRTGFSSSQGALIRTILYSSERVTENSLETLVFICFLLCFALVAAGYVLYDGLNDPSISRFKLFLHCSMIITSVVPPELPMELSLAVNHSLLALHSLGIYCTEPFRIPFAGKLGVCCFDKTGTLTSDELIVQGVAGLPASRLHSSVGWAGWQASLSSEGCSEDLAQPMALPDESCIVLAGCHQLLHVDGQIVGDPMDKAALQAVGWSYSSDGVCTCRLPRRSSSSLIIRRRFPFSSELKRSSTIAEIAQMGEMKPSSSPLRVLTKGAPETVRCLLRAVPEGYDSAYMYHTLRGKRVIALAGKSMGAMDAPLMRALPRDEAERELEFYGFLVLHNPMKSESSPVLAALRDASHQLLMITGDQILTACHAAKELSLITKPALLLELTSGTSGEAALQWVWLQAQEGEELAPQPADLSRKALARLSAGYDLCVAGDVFGHLASYGHSLACLVAHARAVAALRSIGVVCLMCGDGTNDVGALRQSDVGVALVSTSLVAPPPARPLESSDSDRAVRQRRGKAARGETSAERSQRRLEELRQQTAQLPMVKLGDASIAAAFTARSASVAGCLDVIAQGRCTLVTTVQMFKILALNCLVSAYTLSVLHLEGVKLGDTQATVTGILNAALFLFVSFAKPLPRLAPHRPPSVLSIYVFFSIVSQFGVHLYVLVQTIQCSKADGAWGSQERFSEFEPSVPNTVVWLISLSMLITNFGVNYKVRTRTQAMPAAAFSLRFGVVTFGSVCLPQGKPFMEALSANRGLMATLVISAAFTIILVSGGLPDLYSYLELAPLCSEELRSNLMGLMGLDFILCFLFEKAACKMFRF
ncbi:MAG: hypothetical protein SGPRY_000012 [Prymnesium sp.]